MVVENCSGVLLSLIMDRLDGSGRCSLVAFDNFLRDILATITDDVGGISM